MNLQCSYCLETIVYGVRHDCSEVIASLRASCAALRAIVARVEDVEGMAKVMQTIHPVHHHTMKGREDLAAAVSRWLKEGK